MGTLACVQTSPAKEIGDVCAQAMDTTKQLEIVLLELGRSTDYKCHIY